VEHSLGNQVSIKYYLDFQNITSLLVQGKTIYKNKNTGEVCINEKMPCESKQPLKFFIAFDLFFISMAVLAL